MVYCPTPTQISNGPYVIIIKLLNNDVGLFPGCSVLTEEILKEELNLGYKTKAFMVILNKLGIQPHPW